GRIAGKCPPDLSVQQIITRPARTTPRTVQPCKHMKETGKRNGTWLMSIEKYRSRSRCSQKHCCQTRAECPAPAERLTDPLPSGRGSTAEIKKHHMPRIRSEISGRISTSEFQQHTPRSARFWHFPRLSAPLPNHLQLWHC